MKVIEDSPSRIKIKFHPGTVYYFLVIALFVGFYQVFRILTGQSSDYFGGIIFLALPTFLLTVLISIVYIEIDHGKILIKKRYWFRSKINQFLISEIDTFDLSANRGSDTGGTYSLTLSLKDKSHFSIISGFAKLNTSRNRKIINRLNEFLNN